MHPVISSLGRFEIRRRVGSGSFAAVYLAHDPALDTMVALKVLADHHSGDPEVRERFVREARLLRRLGSSAAGGDRLVTVHDIAEVAGQPYLVMEYVAGGSLSERLVPAADPGSASAVASVVASAAGWGAPDLRRLADELAACLSVVHAHGVIHRDVKPSNLLLRGPVTDATGLAASNWPGLVGADEQLVLADFGLARSSEQTNMTFGAGTPGYGAPEQLRASPQVDARADLYAATVVIIAAATGDHPDHDRWRGSTPSSTWSPLTRCLAEDPDGRPADVDAWRAEIERVIEALAGVPAAVPHADPQTGRTPPGWRGAAPRPGAEGETTDPGTASRTAHRWVPQSVVGRGVAITGLLTIAMVAVVAVVAITLAARGPGPGFPGAVSSGSAAPPSAGPQIIGPETLLIGEPGTYRHEDRAGVRYEWRLPDGLRTRRNAVLLRPTSAEDLVLGLTEVDDGQERTSRLVIEVRTP